MEVLDAVPSDEWIPYKRNGEIEFQAAIRSPRLSKWLGDVWESLPVKDRNQISDRLCLISDDSILRFLLTDGLEYDLYGCAVPYTSDRHFIFLNASKMRNRGGSFVRYVIAHELAHVYHNHRHGNKKAKEAEADATALRWGYPDPDPLPIITIKMSKSLPKD
jgi:hypothetical protein